MGAWGAGPFENDDAMDFVSEIASVDDLSTALLLEDDYIEVDQASRIVVVGECVAAMREHGHATMPDELARRIAEFGLPSDALYETARDRVSLVITSSELSELWAESDDRGEFGKAMTDLIDRLNQPPGSAGKPGKKKSPQNHSPCWICGEPMGAEFTQISITTDPQSGMSRGGSVHLACLNGALHPTYIVQDWKFDDAMIDRMADKILGEDSDD